MALIALDASRQREPRPLPPSRFAFPDVRRLARHAPVAAGGDFAPATIVAAYRAGIFPWPHPEAELLWFSPDPRAILPVDGLHVSRRLARTLRAGRFHATVDAAFADVIRGCAARDEGTWITPAIVAAYEELHRLGWAHSVETWTREGDLAGGLYGVRIGAMFGAESMFYRVTDGSKAALVALMEWAKAEGIGLVDIQVLTDHTARMGGVEIPRREYLRRLAAAIEG